MERFAGHYFTEGCDFLIVGAGRFGSRAATILTQDYNRQVTIIDRDPKKLEQIRDLSVTKIQADIIDYLICQQSSLKPESVIIPAVPFHLAFEWLLALIPKKPPVRRLAIPLNICSRVPHPWMKSPLELICSYADFICPEDCPEPEDICTVTGKKRGKPVFEVMAGLRPDGFQTAVIRSRQLAPGLGGYAFNELLVLEERIVQAGKGKWLIGTACRCHGILSALET